MNVRVEDVIEREGECGVFVVAGVVLQLRGEDAAGVWLCVVEKAEMWCLSVWKRHHLG